MKILENLNMVWKAMTSLGKSPDAIKSIELSGKIKTCAAKYATNPDVNQAFADAARYLSEIK